MAKGAMSAPIVDPALNMLVAYARSFLGKYSAVAFIAAGKLPASPMASTQRAMMNRVSDTSAIFAARSTFSATARRAAASGRPTMCSVATPHSAWRQAPADQMPMLHM